MFTEVVPHESSQNHLQQPTDKDYQQILYILNNAEFHERFALREEDCKNIQIGWGEDCHSTSRKIVDINIDKGWERVSGYLVPRQYRHNHGNGWIGLKHHSVIKDEHGSLLEPMELIYPLKKYVFIYHSSGLLGWDLQVK